MKVTNVKIQNFKSIDVLNLDFNNLNVFIGPNASGKSNLVSVFQFFKDLMTSSLEDAISLQGGINYLRNIQLKNSINTEFEFTLSSEKRFLLVTSFVNQKISKYHLLSDEINYKISLKTYKTVENYKVDKEELNVKCSLIETKDDYDILRNRKYDKSDVCGNVVVHVKRSGNNIIYDVSSNSDNVDIKFEDLCNPFVMSQIKDNKLDSNKAFINELMFPFASFTLNRYFDDMTMYDINTSLPKQAVLITGRNTLDYNGANFAVVLKKILKSNDKEIYIKNINNILEFIEDVKTVDFAEKYLMPSMKEKYYPKDYLPGILLSDGTVYVALILIPLLFEEKTLIIMEEPFTKIHPKLISQIMNIIKEVSQEKQIFITTHNPIIIKYVDEENIFTIDRNKNGYSDIKRYVDRDDIKIFIEQKMGVDYLFMKGII